MPHPLPAQPPSAATRPLRITPSEALSLLLEATQLIEKAEAREASVQQIRRSTAEAACAV